MTLCIVDRGHCCCQPDEGVWCPDYKPDWYTKCLMDAIVELRAELAAPVPAREWTDMRERELLIAIKNAAHIAINESEDDEQDNTIVPLEKARAVNKAIDNLGKHYVAQLTSTSGG